MSTRPTGTSIRSNRILAYSVAILLSIAGGIAVTRPPYIYPFALMLAALLLFLMIYSPISTLLVYLVFFIAAPQEWAPYFNHLPPFTERIVGLIAIASLLIPMSLRHRTNIYVGRIGYMIVGVLGAFTVTLIGAVWLGQAVASLINVLRMFIVFLLIINICDSPGKLRAIVWLYFLSVAMLSILSVVHYYTGVVEVRMGITRALGVGGSNADANSHAATIVYVLPLMFYYVRSSPSKVARILLIALGLVECWNIVLTGSRAGMVGGLFMVLLIVMRSRRKMRYAVAGVFLLVFVAVIMPAQYKHRFESIADLSSNTGAAVSARGRLKGLHDGLVLFADHPLTGVGIGCFATARGEELGDWMSSHNMLGQLIGETGLIGTIAFAAFIWAVFRTIRECRRILRRASGSRHAPFFSNMTEAILDSYLLLFVVGLSGHNLYRYNWYFLAAILTVVYRLASAEDRQSDAVQALPPALSVSPKPTRA